MIDLLEFKVYVGKLLKHRGLAMSVAEEYDYR